MTRQLMILFYMYIIFYKQHIKYTYLIHNVAFINCNQLSLPKAQIPLATTHVIVLVVRCNTNQPV